MNNLSTIMGESLQPFLEKLDQIKGSLQFMEMQGLATEASQELLVLKSLVAELSDQVSDFRRIYTQTLDRSVQFSLRAIIQQTKLWIAKKLSTDAEKLVLQIDPMLPDYYVGDPGLIKRMLVHLLEYVLAVAKTSQVHLSFSAEALQQAKQYDVDIYLQLHQTKLDPDLLKQQHYQLGILQALASLAGATLTIENENHFSLKLSIPLQAGSLPHAMLQATDVIKEQSVLLVEPDPKQANNLTTLLKSWGLIVSVVKTGQEALQKMANLKTHYNPYDLVIMERFLPDMDGFLLQQELKKSGIAQSILLTETGQQGDAIKCVQQKIAAYFVKPLEVIDLWNTLKILSHPYEEPAPLITRHLLEEMDHRFNILWIDEANSGAGLSEEILQHQGHRIIHSTVHAQLLEKLSQEWIDLVLVQLVDSSRNEDILKQIRNHFMERGRKVPMIGLSDQRSHLGKTSDLPVDTWIPRVFSYEQLMDAVKNLVMQ